MPQTDFLILSEVEGRTDIHAATPDPEKSGADLGLHPSAETREAETRESGKSWVIANQGDITNPFRKVS
jgi:hypothetical protein